MACLCVWSAVAQAQAVRIVGTVRDDTGAPLPGVSVELRAASGSTQSAITDRAGAFEFRRLAPDTYKAGKHAKIGVDVFNLLNAVDSDIDYFYASRLPGEPLDGIDDIHTHPTLPRSARISLSVGF
ncbi:MAG TPA: carboxypeptidase-like regulatory domain-containing protein [Vicinamibacterales bacterium]|jgi:protocatechuate 3,4-dioxygenase beta subunit|nr:carboxypeptidase-like regulatory domain-containing protein [Vicinamibacterales bacterium]